MKTRRFSRRNALRSAARRLGLEPLETRMLLASLTSRLPPIIVDPGSDPVQIRQLADPTRETTLPSAAVSAMHELILVRDMVADLNMQDDSSLLADLQREIWAPVVAVMEDDLYAPLELDAAIELATTGFEVILPPLDIAIERVFGSSLSESRPVVPTPNAPDTDVDQNSPPNDSSGSAIGPSDTFTFAIPTTELVSETESRAEDESESGNDANVAQPEDRGAKKTKNAVAETLERPIVIDEVESHNKERGDRGPKTNDMLLLPQPSTVAQVPTNQNTNRSHSESPSDFGIEEARVGLADQSVLGQMLLLPMVQDSTATDVLARPMVIAGFNPVAMLQIFIGTELGGALNGGLELTEGVASRDRETDSASSLLDRSDRLALTAFVVIVGYWYFHSKDEVSSSTPLRSAASDRRPRRWRRLLLGGYFGYFGSK
jgi:hypothetical protein